MKYLFPLLLLFACSPFVLRQTAIAQDLESVHKILSTLYIATGGDQWNDNTNWDITRVPNEEELGEWYGIGLSEGRLTSLNMNSNNLTGTIPAELGNLSELVYLSLGNNSLTGPIPVELGSLLQLKSLILSHNSLTGPIPPRLGNLLQLKSLFLSHNSLTGPIPAELGNLSQLEELVSVHNSLTGPIPAELGNLSQLGRLHLSENSLTGPIPAELGNLSQLGRLHLSGNSLTGRLPRNFMKMDNLETLYFGGQGLCAPEDDEFQTWLQRIQSVRGPTCMPLKIAGTIEDQSYPVNEPIIALVLPEAIGGISPISYILSPALPAGLNFDSSTRTLSGTPTLVTSPTAYTYKVTDADGTADSLLFSIEVSAPVSIEGGVLPENFAVLGNYPNPFQGFTQVTFDLPWPAQVKIEVMDVTGRQVLTVPQNNMQAGWGQSIQVNGASLSVGVYLYRLIVDSPAGTSVQVGRFVRLR